MAELVQKQRTRNGPARRDADRPGRTADAAIAGLVALLASLAWVGAWAAGLEPQVRSGSGTSTVNLVSVIVVSLVVSLVGAGLLRVLEHRTAQGLRVWTIVAVLLWVASFTGPLSATRVSTALVLAGLHLVVGAVVIIGLRRTHSPNPAAPRVGA